MKNNFLLLTLLLAAFEAITYLSTDMYLPALPIIQTEFHLTHAQVQLTLTWWFIGASMLQLILGPLADKWGRRPILFFGTIIFSVASFICGYTDSYFLFTVCRFLQGCSVCTVLVSAYATIHELFDTKHAVKAVALMSAITLLAPALGPLLGSLVMKFANWRVNFSGLAISCLFVTIGLVFVMPETLKKPRSIKIGKTIKQYIELAYVLGFLLPTLMVCLEFAGFISWITASPLLLMTHFKLTQIEFSFCQLIVFASFIVGTQFVKLLIDKKTLIQIVQVGVTTACIGALICLISFFISAYYEILILGMIFYAIGSGLMSSALNRLAMEVEGYPMGTKTAFYSFLISVFGVLGSLLINYFYLTWIVAVCGFASLFLYYYYVSNKNL